MQRGNRSRAVVGRARRIAIATMVLLVIGSSAAVAANEPLFESSFPSTDGTARSQDVGPIWAIFDRPLNEAHSRMRVVDNALNDITGVTYLTDPQGNIGGHRRINFLPTASLSEAASPYTVVARVRARVPGGETRVEWQFSIDDTAPFPPVVISPTNGSVVTDQPVIVNGSGEPGATVLVLEEGDLIAQDVVSSQGDYDVFLPYPPEDGVSRSFELFQRDPAGNTSAGTGTITIWHDSIVQVPTITFPTEGAHLNTPTVNVRGTAKPNTTVRIREGGPVIGTTSADADGDWMLPLGFAVGPHSITAESWDGVTLDGPSPARAFTMDFTPPAAPVINTPTPGQAINTGDVTISGTAEPLATVRIRHLGIIRGDVTVDGAGAWSLTLPFGDGAHTIEAWAVDRATNVGPSAFRSFTVDSVLPATPVIDAPAEDAFLNVNWVGVSGLAEPDATVEILVGTVVVGSTTSNGVGSWNTSVFFIDGAHTITARAVDDATNQSPESGPRSFTVDTVAPPAPTIIEPAEGSTQTSSTTTITGTGEPAATIEVYEGVTLIADTVADSEGNWETSAPLPDGPHTITARAVDLAGNVGPSSGPRSFMVSIAFDNTPPGAPVLIDPAQNSLQPGFVIFRGTAEPGATIRVFEGAALVAHGTASAGTFQIGGPLPTGSHTVTATATDAAGNVSPPTAPRTFTVDATRPQITIDTPSGSVFLPLQSPLIKGSATDNTGVDRVEIEIRNLTGQLVEEHIASTCTGCPATSILWSDEPSLAPGVYDVTAHAVDVVNNRSVGATITILVI